MPKKKRAAAVPTPPGSPAPHPAAKKKSGRKAHAKGAAPTLLSGPGPHANQLLLAPPKGAATRVRERVQLARTLLREKVLRARRASADWTARAWVAIRPGLKRLADVLGVLAVLAVLGAVLFLGYSWVISDRVLPNTSIAGTNVGGLRLDDARRAVSARIDALEQQGFTLQLPTRSVVVHPVADLGMRFDLDAAMATAARDGRTGDWWEQQRQRFAALLSASALDLPVEADATTVAARLRGRISELAEAPVEPQLRWGEEGLQFTPGKAARAADMPALVGSLAAHARGLNPATLPVELAVLQPQVSDAEAQRAQDQARKLVNATVVLTYSKDPADGPWRIALSKDPTWIVFTPVGSELRVQLDRERLVRFLTETVAKDVDQEHADARLTHAAPDSWRVTVEGRATDGHQLQVDAAVGLVQAGLSSEAIAKAQAEIDAAAGKKKPALELSFDLPSTFEPGRVLDEDGQDMGLRDRLAYARSNFSESPSGRDFNVRKGMKIFNGLLIPQGETFSFNSFLGPVDNAHGWKDALAIFQGGLDTRMDPGGGICQVSTTVYQAAVLAGVKVTVRRAHSYFVSYYAKPPGLSGVDATIYPGAQDLQFVNDTPGPILMLAGADGNIAWVQLFGTKDRTVDLKGPFRSGSYGGGAPILTVDPTLAPGQVVIEKGGHAGFSISWKQTIRYDDGRPTQEIPIYSGYKAIPSQGRKGPDAAPVDPNAPPTTVATN